MEWKLDLWKWNGMEITSLEMEWNLSLEIETGILMEIRILSK